MEHDLHAWNVDYSEAVAIQRQLVQRLIHTPVDAGKINLVAGVDVSSNKYRPEVYAAVVLMSVNDQEIIEVGEAIHDKAFPYIPGLLSFREGPVVLEAFSRLRRTPDVVIFDGQGIAHPRGLGLAAHLGLWLGLPSIGCAKSRLVGEYEDPCVEAGCRSPLRLNGETIGMVYRSRTGVKPVFISEGHLINLESAIQIVARCLSRYRIPEPIRAAHRHCNRLRTGG